MNIYELPGLSKLIKNFWNQSHKWRFNEGNIEFSLPTTFGDEWFPLYQSPLHVEKFVKAWIKSGGLSNDSI